MEYLCSLCSIVPPCVPRACEISNDGDDVASTRLCAGFSPWRPSPSSSSTWPYVSHATVQCCAALRRRCVDTHAVQCGSTEEFLWFCTMRQWFALNDGEEERQKYRDAFYTRWMWRTLTHCGSTNVVCLTVWQSLSSLSVTNWSQFE